MKVLKSTLNGVSLGEQQGIRRSPPGAASEITQQFRDRYDALTLFYCAVFDQHRKRLSLFGPPLLNLKRFVLDGTFSCAFGDLDRLRIHRFDRFHRLDIACDRLPEELTFRNGDFSASLRTDLCDSEAFAGRNVVYTMSRDNDPLWIRDWMIWNRKRHGADAIILADNGSSAYSIDELADVLSSVEGYRAVAVVSAPQRYGPDNQSATRGSAGAFLQVAMMNALWLRWMSSARAVLNVDVDELVTSPDGGSIFDAAVASFFGVVMCKGRWRYAGGDMPSGVATHADHVMLRPGDADCPPKYCLRPNSVAGRRSLQVHRVNGFKRMPFVSRDKFSFYHCRSISTFWKPDRAEIEPISLATDPATVRDMASVFSTPSLPVPGGRAT